MFGGHGLYLDELFVAIVADDTLFLKTDAATAPRFAAAGGRPFVFVTRGRETQTGFWTPPSEALDAPPLLEPWARLAVEAALRARAAASGRRKLRPAPGPVAPAAPAAGHARKRTNR